MSTVRQRCVLLSGGMDSVAALHWSIAQGGTVRAICFDYGQPNRDNELYAAQATAARRSVPLAREHLADAVRTGAGLFRGVKDHDDAHQGLHPAFVPGRNAVFLSIAAAHAATWFPVGTIALVVGANADDARGFPDCGQSFFHTLARALSRGTAREIEIEAPFVGMTKAGIVAQASDAAREDMARSWSCYRGDRVPCGTCSPCVLRAAAFSLVGLADRSAPAIMHGGDGPTRKDHP